MGFFGFVGKLLGIKQGQPYVDAGMALTMKFCRIWSLPDWKDGLPDYTQEERKAIERGLAMFQGIANQEMGGEAMFHPDYVDEIRRKLVGDALEEYAETQTLGIEGWPEEDPPPDWKPVVSTYLKAWAATLNPMTLIKFADCLRRIGKPAEAKEVYGVVLLLPTYWKTLWGKGDKQEQLTRTILATAKEELAELD